MGGDDRKECAISLTGDVRTMSSSGTDPMVSLPEGRLEPWSRGEITGADLFSSKMRGGGDRDWFNGITRLNFTILGFCIV